jgi:hypothetical protein
MTMAGCPPSPTRHNSAPAPSTLAEELLLVCFMLVCRDGAQPRLSPVCNRPYPSAGAVSTFLPPRDGREDRQGIDSPPQNSQDTDTLNQPCRHAGVAPLRRRRLSAHRRRHSGGGCLPPTSSPTSTTTSASSRPLRNARPPTHSQWLLPQSLGGTCGGVLSVPAVFPALIVT